MTPSDSATTRVAPDWRISLPTVLLIFGVALSCSTACITSAIVERASSKIASANQRREVREKNHQMLEPLLPPSGAGSPELEIGDEDSPRRITLTGRYAAGSSERFFAAVRALYGSVLSFDREVVAQIFDNSKSPPALLATGTFHPASELKARLTPLLPSAANVEGEISLSVVAEGQARMIVFADGNFSQPSHSVGPLREPRGHNFVQLAISRLLKTKPAMPSLSG